MKKKSACYDIHCENGGKCFEPTSSCVCPQKFSVPLCRVEKDFCLGNSCGNGTCISTQGKAVCHCYDGFEGEWKCTNLVLPTFQIRKHALLIII